MPETFPCLKKELIKEKYAPKHTKSLSCSLSLSLSLSLSHTHTHTHTHAHMHTCLSQTNIQKHSDMHKTQVQVLNKRSLAELIEQFPEDHNIVCQNLWAQFDIGSKGNDNKLLHDVMNLDKEKMMTKKRIMEATNFRRERLFNALCKASRSGDLEAVSLLARQVAPGPSIQPPCILFCTS